MKVSFCLKFYTVCNEIIFWFPERIYSNQIWMNFYCFRKGDSNIWLETTKARAVKETKADNKRDVTKGECSKSHKNKADVESKFENYFSFSAPIKSVKPYQVSELLWCMWVLSFILVYPYSIAYTSHFYVVSAPLC